MTDGEKRALLDWADSVTRALIEAHPGSVVILSESLADLLDAFEDLEAVSSDEEAAEILSEAGIDPKIALEELKAAIAEEDANG